MKEHWDNVYSSREIEKTGWYEKVPEPSLELISKIPLGKNDLILDIGSGAGTFIDNLVARGFENIAACDISGIALNALATRLGTTNASKVHFLTDDVTHPAELRDLKNVALWHDRALLHFLLDEEKLQAYRSLLNSVLSDNGYVIIAAFSLKGVQKCSGLNIKNYDQEMIAGFLGDEFRLLHDFDYLYHTPSGDPRPYVYTLFQKTGASG